MASRKGVVLLASRPPDQGPLSQMVDRLHDAGARVVLATYGTGPTSSGADQTVDLRAGAQGHGPAFRRALRGATPARRFWLHVRDDETVAGLLPEVAVVVHLDPVARVAARRLAALHPHLMSANGVDRALVALRAAPSGRAAGPRTGPVRDLLRRGLILSPWLPEARRADLARGAALDLVRRGDDRRAERVVRRALRRITGPGLRADLLGDVVSRTLADGRPSPLVADTVEAELALADRQLRGGHSRAAAGWFAEALRTAYHPTLHFHRLDSPLAADPEGFTAPLRESAVAKAMRAGGGLEAATARAPRAPETGGATRLVIATRGSQAFVGEIRRHFEQRPDVETRFADFTDLPGLRRYLAPAAFAEQLLAGKDEMALAAEALFRPHLDWADVVFVDWCTALAAILPRLEHGGARVIVRLHSYEVFTHWPQLVDFRGVDDLVFVSDHLRDFCLAAIPALREPGAPRLHVLINAMDLRRMVRPKPPDARFALALVGAHKVVKDPRWAVEVLRVLRKHDQRYRLLLVGGPFQDLSPATHRYAEALARDVAELGDAVESIGFTDDVPAVLERAGVVLSASVRESFHVGLAEGAASGALPVVRDWPFFPGAARTLFPPDWVVGTPAQAADRILAGTGDEQRWREAGAAASRLVLERWDWSVTQAGYDGLVG